MQPNPQNKNPERAMHAWTVVGAVSLMLVYAGCSSEIGQEAVPTPEKPAAAAAGENEACLGDCEDGGGGAAPDVAVGLGKGMTLTDFTLISEVLAAPESFVGKRVLVKGEAVGVCEKRGCWVNLKSDKVEDGLDTKIQIKVTDGEIVFPMTCLGKVVTAEGIVEKLVISVERLQAAAKKRAEAKGETADLTAITEPRIIWRIKGLGANING